MDRNAILEIAATGCRPEDEDKYNKWYNEVHIPMILKYKGIKRAGRYKRVGNDEKHSKYLALYEFESKEAVENFHNSPELAEAMKELEQTWKNGGIELKWVVSYEPIKIWERK
jgi:uncharacterized protein (DUF1330 family)